MDIKNYEAMVKLDLPEDERTKISGFMAMLDESFKVLKNIDTSDISPLVSVLDIKNVLREDVSVKFMPREKLLANAPEQYDGYFQVPKTLE